MTKTRVAAVKVQCGRSVCVCVCVRDCMNERDRRQTGMQADKQREKYVLLEYS